MYNLVNLTMPVFEGKKEIVIGSKVSQAENDAFMNVCLTEDRSMSYVLRELALRGLAQYMRDGKLKLTEDEEKVFDKRNKLEPLEMIQVERGGKVNEYRINIEKHHTKLKKYGSNLLKKMVFHSFNTQRFVNSAASHLVQVADVCAYGVHRQFQLHGNEWEDAESERLELTESFAKIHTKFRNFEGKVQGWGIVKMPQNINRGWGF